MGALQKILAIVARPPMPMAFGLALVLAVLWFGGLVLEDAYGWPGAGLRVALCILTVALGAAWVVGRKVRDKRKARAIENEIRAQAKAQTTGVRPDRQRDFDELQKRFDEALEALKASKLGKSALYALPWYVIIGPPGSGKTTAITESGLDFPFMKGPQQKRGIRGVGGTRNCDWWFTDRAILLDTAGRYTTEAEDHEEWLAFLGMIKKARKLKPINGVLVAISVADVLAADEQRLEQHADTIRQRIDELVKQLEVVFPIYLLFTKCDLLDGFVEFFGAMSKEERGQVWGATFDRATGGEAMQDRFAVELQLMYERLAQERLRLLVPDRPVQQQAKLLSLPLQVRASARRLKEFVRLLTQPNPYSEGAPLRGFYLTSGTQEGAPIDQVLQSMSAAFGLTPQADAGGGAPVEAKSYFLRDLFAKNMAADRDLARSSARVQRQRELMRKVTIWGSAAAGVLFAFLAITSYAGTKGLVEDAGAAIAASVPIDPAREGAPPAEAAGALDRLRDAAVALHDAHSATSLLGPSRDVVAKTLAAYAARASDAFLRPAKVVLEKRLQEYVGRRAAGAEFAKNKQLVVAYAALDSDRFDFVPTAMLRDALRQQNLWKWSPKELETSADTHAASSESRHLEAYLTGRQFDRGPWLIGNQKELLGRAQEKLRSGGELESAAKVLLEKDEALQRLSEADLAEALREKVVQDDPSMKNLTPEHMQSIAGAVRKEVVFERIAAIGLAKDGSLEEIAGSLRDLDSPEGPAVTEFAECLSRLRTAGAIPGRGLGKDPLLETFVDALKTVAALHDAVANLYSGRSRGRRVLPAVRENDAKTLDALTEGVRDAGKKIDRALVDIREQLGADPEQVRVVEPIHIALHGMLDSVREGVAREARAELSDHWNETVGRDLGELLAAFPFDHTAAADADPAAFAALLKPGGRLAEVMDTVDKVIKLREVGRGLELSDEFTAFRQRIANVRAACFDPQPPHAARIAFRVHWMDRGENVRDISLVLEPKTEVRYSADNQTARANQSRQWRIGDVGSELRMQLTIEEGGAKKNLSIPSEKDPARQSRWGFLRVLQAAKSVATPEGMRFTWTADWQPPGDNLSRTFTCSVVLKAEGAHDVFEPSFLALRPPERLFKKAVP